jgi:hypothetical protein
MNISDSLFYIKGLLQESPGNIVVGITRNVSTVNAASTQNMGGIGVPLQQQIQRSVQRPLLVIPVHRHSKQVKAKILFIDIMILPQPIISISKQRLISNITPQISMDRMLQLYCYGNQWIMEQLGMFNHLR